MSSNTSPFKCRNSAKLFTLTMATVLFILIFMQLDFTFPWNPIKNSQEMTTQNIQNTCKGTLFPTQLNTESNWGPVDKNKTVFVISAYYVNERDRIFIIGSKPFYEVDVVCQIWSRNNEANNGSIRQTRAKVVAPIGATGYDYTSTIFECKIETMEQPTHVSLVMTSCDSPSNLLEVRDASKPSKYGRRFTVCLSPMFEYNDPFQLVEWIEFNKILGAEKFILYNYSTGVNVNKVINHYVKLDSVEVVQWYIPFNENIEYFAQKAALNDCIFRNRKSSEFVSNIDKDEYIIPHSENDITWSQMIEHFDKNYAGYLIRHTFFRKDWKIRNQNFSDKYIADNANLVTLRHFEHEDTIWPPNHRSKYFARTAYVEFGNIHEIPRGRIFTVPVNIGLLHHYRTVKDSKIHKKVKDFTVLIKYGHALAKNVQTTWSKLSNDFEILL